MLQWTTAGAVEEPTVLQIRVGSEFEGRVAAGAPRPLRPLTPEEVRLNIRHFSKDRVGPRTPACTRIVLSGVESIGSLASVMQASREWGVEHVTWHADESSPCPELSQLVDEVVVRVSGGAGAGAVWRDWVCGDTPVTAVVVLNDAWLRQGLSVQNLLLAHPPSRVILTWPFPGGTSLPAPVVDAVPLLTDMVSALEHAGVTVGIKGLPPCVLADAAVPGRWPERVWRTRNRWYVDADHQRSQALLFLPDVLRFGKPDACRFCRLGAVCDGVAEAWLLQGRVPGIRAFR